MSRSPHSIEMGERVMNDLSEDILQLEDIINSRDKEREATNAFLAEMLNGNPVRKTKSDVGKFKTWLNQQNEEREVESIPSPELDLFLARFFMTAKKGDGGEYEPDTLKSMQGSINRFLAEKGSLVNLIEDKDFKHSRDVLTSKRKYLRQQGKGNRPNQADPFTKEKLDMLYQKGLLGGGNMYFGMRSRTEHEHLRWGDVELKTTSSGERYLEYSERATKTRTGVNSDSRAFPPKMFEDKGNQRCPIQMYLLYAQKRPVNMKEDEAKFYVGINNKASSGEWFKNMAMGKNTIGKIVKTMAEEGGIEGRKVNHSARKTGITTLIHNGVQDTLVQQHSGHKSLASINNYSKASINQQREMSMDLQKERRKKYERRWMSISRSVNKDVASKNANYTTSSDDDEAQGQDFSQNKSVGTCGLGQEFIESSSFPNFNINPDLSDDSDTRVPMNQNEDIINEE
ncbi:Hypothetical predicted protein [Mytilus galloprovincialis]|uniref:Tyr recombinase domain-containing protein n=1 Tax=Mytilus galloprovincialis TaxID=29158 RepID=A0A8B6HNE3_MYTGA|nr:Hypothetical predicted protein [Mytilus galloprovincialis]